MILEGRTAIVTGASSGIGRAIALALAQEGTELYLLGRRVDALQDVAALARTTTRRAEAISVDLACEDTITGVVDMLIHSAGIIVPGTLDHAPAGDLDQQYRVNLRAPYVLTQALLPLMPAPGGQIIFMNSTVGLRSRGSVGQYAATKHALKAMADSLREELNQRGIKVTSFYLGRTATPMQAAVHAWENRPYHPALLLQTEDIAALVLHTLRLPPTAEVTEIRIRPMRRLPEARARKT
jgi:short-subunit dehydrogenase